MMMDATDVKSLGLFKLVLGALALFVIFKVIQRLYFHPLSKVPGPWYAAVSTLYEFYWDCLQSGGYWRQIENMHNKYGPIVRINPWEVHINDPAFMDTLWANSKMEKDPFFYGGFGIDSAAVSTVSAEMHRIRRGAMAPFFSKANVLKLEPRVLSRVRQLCGRIDEFKAEDKPICISNAIRCLATDITTDYAVPKTRNLLAHPDFASTFVRVVRDTAGIINWKPRFSRHIRFIYPLMVNIPISLVRMLDKDGAATSMVANQNDLYDQAQAVVENAKTNSSPTVINAIFDHPSLPPEEKKVNRIFDETVTVIGAGTETLGHTFAILTFYVLYNPRIIQTVKAELEKAAAEHNVSRDSFLDCRIVESLPYLQAVMKEGLRYSSAVVGRLPRRNPTAPMTYTTPDGKTYVLPPKTPASMSVRDIHFNADIFKDPYEFRPERWLVNDPVELARLDKHMVAFGKGVRACLGLELAKQEILLVAGNIFWKYDFELYDTTLWDVTLVHDFFSPFGPSESKGVQVKVKKN